MKDTIYLYASREGVDRMRKNLSSYARHEIPIKLTVEVDDKAFKVPVVEKHVYIEEWEHGIDMDDVQFKKDIITKEEAEQIRQKRMDKMTDILKSQGYQVLTPEELEVEK